MLCKQTVNFSIGFGKFFVISLDLKEKILSNLTTYLLVKIKYDNKKRNPPTQNKFIKKTK